MGGKERSSLFLSEMDSHQTTIGCEMPYIFSLSLIRGAMVGVAVMPVLGFILAWRPRQAHLFSLRERYMCYAGQGIPVLKQTYGIHSPDEPSSLSSCERLLSNLTYLFLLRTLKISFLVKKRSCVKTPRKIIQCCSISLKWKDLSIMIRDECIRFNTFGLGISFCQFHDN